MYFLIFIFVGLIPFSYQEILGIRVLLIQVVVGLIAFTLQFLSKRNFRFYFEPTLILLFLLWFLMFAFSLHTNSYNELLSLSVFSLLLFLTTQVERKGLNKLITFYQFSVLFTASGVFLQFILHKLAGIQIFRYELFGGGRHAYSFLWEDYSFLSLFLASAVPLFLNKKINFSSIFFSLFLLTTSVITSARTGVVSFIIFAALYVAYELMKSIYSGRINKKLLAATIIIFLTPALLILSMQALTGRQVSISSSGRFDGFIIGYNYFIDHFWFGVYFDKLFYSEHLTAIPHNIFIYMLYMGGLISFTLFVIWFLLVCANLRNVNGKIIRSLIVCLIGFQFIPSFFSAYFIAILLGMAFVSTKPQKMHVRILEEPK